MLLSRAHICSARITCFLWCDSTSAFKGKGHVGPIKLIKEITRFIRPLSQLGNSWTVTDYLIDQLEESTCAIYGNVKFFSVNKLRYFKFKLKCDGKTDATKNIDLAVLPLCKKLLIQHIKGVHFQVGIWKNTHEAQPNIPDPWEKKAGQIRVKSLSRCGFRIKKLCQTQ